MTYLNKKGFTLIELLVVVSIVAIMSGVMIVNFRKGEASTRLQQSAQQITQAIRKAQNMALSSAEVEEDIYDYYGIHFHKDMPDYFYVFANNDEVYNQNAKIAEIIKLEDGIVIDSFSTPTRLNITFLPPYAFIKFNPNMTNATITIKQEGGTCPQDCKCVRINNKGWMSIKTGAECEEELPGICQDGAGSDDPDCGIIDCSGWYVQIGTESATETEYCYDKQDITSNRCEDVGDCKDPNTSDCDGQSNDALQYSCGTCKYISASNCTGTTLGSCLNYPEGTVCGADEKCDGNGNCVSACVPNMGDPCGGTACVNPGTIQCDGSCAGTSNKPVGTDCTLCKVCDGNGNCTNVPADDTDCGIISCDDWHHIVGSADPQGTNYCYDSPDITSNRCEGISDCKDANTVDCGSADDTLELSCGTCKYVAGCSGTTDGYCADYGDALVEEVDKGDSIHQHIYGPCDGLPEKYAGQFKISSQKVIRKIKLRLLRNDPIDDNITVRIETDSGGLPSGNLVHPNAQKTMPANDVPIDTVIWHTFEFPDAFILQANTYYHIVLQRTGGCHDQDHSIWWYGYYWYGSPPEPWPNYDGAAEYYMNGNWYNDTNWRNIAMQYKLYTCE